jgi:hypothetical protein
LAGAEGLEPPNAVLETAVLPLKLRPCFRQGACRLPTSLLDFFVRLMLAALGAELLELETIGSRLLVLHVRVVPIFAFRTLKRDYFARHDMLLD